MTDFLTLHVHEGPILLRATGLGDLLENGRFLGLIPHGLNQISEMST